MSALARAKTDLERETAELRNLEEKLHVLQIDVTYRRERISKLADAISLLSKYESPEPTAVPPESQVSGSEVIAADEDDVRQMDKSSAFYGKSLTEAAILVLEASGEPQTAFQIVNALHDGGWDFGKRTPSTTVYWALRKRSLSIKDVASVPNSKWALTSWGLESDAAKQAKAGLDRARARGVRMGAPLKLTSEDEERLVRLRADGVKITDLAKQFDISVPTVHRILKRKENPTPDLTELARAVIAGPAH